MDIKAELLILDGIIESYIQMSERMNLPITLLVDVRRRLKIINNSVDSCKTMSDNIQ